MSTSPVIIRVEELSKRYELGRQTGQDGAHYKTLREALASSARRWWQARRRPPTAFGAGSAATQGARPARRREEFWALRDVSFSVRQGEVVGIVGRNGAGKSTLLKVLSRITEPTSGRVRLRGRVASLLEVGTGFHPELTGRENIFLNGAILGMGRAEIRAKFDEIVAFAEVARFLDTPVKRYSSGMYVRLAFAVAAHLEPEVLIVDEVLAVGDAAFQKKCLGKMGQVARDGGRTVLFVSHNLNAVESLCGRVIRLHQGRLVDQGEDVHRILRNYAQESEPGMASRGEWTNTGGAGARFDNPWFRPERFFLGDARANALPQPVRNDGAIFIYVDGTVEKSDPALKVGFTLLDEEGHELFVTTTTDGPEDGWPRLGPGSHRLRCQIPPRLLNEGTYTISLHASLHWREWISQPGVNAPSINLSIQGGLSDSPYWTDRRHGLIAPVLDWRATPGLSDPGLADEAPSTVESLGEPAASPVR